MKLTKLKDHAILNTVSETTRVYIARCHPTEPDNAPIATEKESYAIETLLSLSSVVSCLDQLHFSVNMLTGYRSKSTPEKMNRYDYIVFGMENYYLRLTSVYDRCLRLGNIVFQLGLPERECRETTITNNSYIKGTPVAKALKDMDKFTSQFRFQRNTLAHKSTYSESELNKLGSYYFIAEEDPQLEKYSHIYKRKTNNYVADKKEAFQNHIEELESFVEAFLRCHTQSLSESIKKLCITNHLTRPREAQSLF